MPKLIFHIFLLGIFLIPCQNFAQNNFEGGLLLSGNYKLPYNKKTSVQFTPNSPIKLQNKFEINFDLAFWDMNQFGPILQGKDKNGLLNFDLMNVYYKNNDTLFIQLIINKIPTGLIISIEKSKIYRNNWFNISLKFDLLKDEISGELNGKFYSKTKFNLNDKLNLHFFAGLYDFAFECPRIALKNMKIKNDENKIIHFWKFNEFNGEVAKDHSGNSDAKIKNGEWLLQKHAKWEKIVELEFESEPRITFNKNENKFYTNSKNSITEFDLLTNSVKKYSFEVNIPQRNYLVYNPVKDQLYHFYSGKGEVSVFNFDIKSWSKIDTTADNLGRYYGHSNFINPLTGDLLIFGGYGWYTCKNHLQKYNFTTKNWEIIETLGDSISPRYLDVVIGNDTSKNKIYIFNGFGNESGKQEIGFKQLNDFYELDLKNYSYKKFWAIEDKSDTYDYSERMIYDKNKDMFYVIGKKLTPIVGQKDRYMYDTIYLYGINKTEAKINLLNKYKNENNLEDPFDLFYSKETNEIILATNKFEKSGRKITLYSMLFPPLTQNEINELTPAKNALEEYYIYMISGFAALVFAVPFVIYIRKKKNNKKEISQNFEIPENITEEKIFAENEIPLDSEVKNSICLFGNFEVIDKNGNEISDQFKPKLRQLFLLILVNSKANKGITSEKLTSILWPEADNTQAKNNRNASISRLRNILSEIDGIEILHQNNKWVMEISEKLSLDVKKYHDLKSRLKNDFTKAELNRFINLISKGRFLNDIDYEWLDSIKSDIISEVIEISLSISENEKVKNDDELLLKLSDAILIWDSVNEKAIKLKINALTNLGRNGEAKLAYENFVLNYRKIFESDYKSSFQELLNEKNI